MRLAWLCRVLTWLTLSAAAAQAQQAVPRDDTSRMQTREQRKVEAEDALQAALQVATRGPATIQLLDQGTLRLPAYSLWVPRDQANRLIVAWGNTRSHELVGLVLGGTGAHDWTAVMSYTPSGFIKDDDANALDAVRVLRELRQSTDEENESRVARGFPAVALGEWLQRPTYDAAAKRLIWAFPLTPRDTPGARTTVNYNTRALGRYGYFSLNLLTDPAHFAAEKPVADTLLGGLAYQPGKTYADFNAGTDHVAEYGLAALIGVVALKKLGIIALGGAFFLKFAKLGVLAVVGAGAAVRRFVSRKRGGAGRA